MFLFISCEGNSQNIKIKQILSELCVLNTNIAFNNDSLFILEIKSPKYDTVTKNNLYKHLIYNGDTLKRKEYKALNNVESDFVIQRMNGAPLSITNIGKFIFKYDSIPLLLKDKFKDSEVVERFLDGGNYWTFVTINYKTARYRFYVSKKNGLDTTGITLPDIVSKPEFVLENKLGSQLVLMFNKVYFMNNNLVEVNAYKLVDGKSRKRSF